MATSPSKGKRTSDRKSTSLFFKSFYEFVPASQMSGLPSGMRGLYALYQEDKAGKLNLAYVGMTGNGAKGRLGKHTESKAGSWSHCSVFEVWDNITQSQIEELEALFRHSLRKDATASALNIQKGSAMFRRLRDETIKRSTA